MTTATVDLLTEQHALMQEIFTAQRANQANVASTTARERIAKCGRLTDAVLKYRQEIKDAMYADFRKHPTEVDLTEIYVITSEFKQLRRNLRRWMRPRRVGTPLAFMGSQSWVRYEPKGTVLVMAPWNFPVQLTLVPVMAAVAAGNTVMVKPSEFTPNTSALLKHIIEETFPPEEVALFEGGVETAQALLELPFNHIFFTGSPAVGKIVMQAAAKHLASVTLELGGKSPTIVDETADLALAARRITWSKFVNNGQICIAPDYVLVHESRLNEFADLLGKNLREFYGDDPAEAESYARIVNARHCERVQGYLEDAVRCGATVRTGGRTDATQCFIEPTVITDVPLDSELMQQEIFGPVLPVLPYRQLDEAISLVNSREKPLALYVYSRKQANIRRIIENTRAGGTCINHSAAHYYNPNLPFGGVNNSGIGKGHGFYSFESFSNARGVYRQNVRNALDLLTPPYTGFKQWLIDFTIRWL